jgi:hypothetical protein
VTDRPVLFSTPMIRAILEGKKTQTRRVVTASNSEVARKWNTLDFADAYADPGGTWLFGPGPYLKVKCPSDDTRHRVYPRVQPGDRLWVRETFIVMPFPDSRDPTDVVYYADADELIRRGFRPWRPSIFMPRWASRITLEVTTVRVERAQSISARDALCEGVAPPCILDNFQRLWNSINGKRPGCAWASNPWVWVVEFRRAS